MAAKKHILVVGFGLAGAAVAAHLEKQQAEFKVLSSPNKSSSSRVAAGMFNPIVFRRLLKTWMADDILPYARTFYKMLEERLKTEFYHPLPYFKIFGKEESDFWTKRIKDSDTKPYITENSISNLQHKHLKTPYGAGEVFGAGYLNINVYLNAYAKYLEEKDRLFYYDFQYSDLGLSGSKAKYNHEEYDHVVFCEGSHGIHNPWFKDLNFKPTKGEILTIKSDLHINFAVNKNGFVLPLGDHIYKIGATYAWKDLSETPTAEGERTLREKFSHISDVSYKIISHDAGIRPTLANRRPVYHQHEDHKQLAILNGLGTKGVMLAPYFANELVRKLI